MQCRVETVYGGAESVAFEVVATSEPFNATFAIDELLFARVERMALAANLDPDIFFRRTGVDNVAARTRYRRLKVFRMNTFTHR